jgi:hypothetical protein
MSLTMSSSYERSPGQPFRSLRRALGAALPFPQGAAPPPGRYLARRRSRLGHIRRTAKGHLMGNQVIQSNERVNRTA